MTTVPILAEPWVSRHPQSLLLGAAVVVVLSAVLLLLRGFSAFFIGTDHRVSTSKTVTTLWTLVVAWAVSTVLIEVIGLSGLPGHDLAKDFGDKLKPLSDTYLLLLGGPFAALVLAKGITVTRLTSGNLMKTDNSGPITPAQLVTNDSGNADLVDFQFCLFNFIALTFVITAFAWHPDKGLPAIPTALAGLTSVSALAFTANKAFTNNSPIISSVKVTPPTTADQPSRLEIRGGSLGGASAVIEWDGSVVNPVPAASSDVVLIGQLTPSDVAAGNHTLVVSVTDDQTTLQAKRSVKLPTT